MKFRLRTQIINAIQWKGWPHQIKGLVVHTKYPQLAMIDDDDYYMEVYPTDWIVTLPNKIRVKMTDLELNNKYEKV